MRKLVKMVLIKRIARLLICLCLLAGTLAAVTPVTARGQADVSLLPSVLSVGVGDEFEVKVQVESGSQAVTGVGAYLDFDSTRLMVMDADSTQPGVQITPGLVFPLVIENEVDNSAGQIDFSAGTVNKPFPSGTLVLATIRFKALVPAVPATAVTFSTVKPRETKVGYGPENITGIPKSASYSILRTESSVDSPFPIAFNPGLIDSRLPSVTPGRASLISSHTALLIGSLKDLGAAESVRVFFEWGLTMDYGNTTPGVIRSDKGWFAANIDGLSPGITYHYRIVTEGNNLSSPVYGPDMTFTTRQLKNMKGHYTDAHRIYWQIFFAWTKLPGWMMGYCNMQ